MERGQNINDDTREDEETETAATQGPQTGKSLSITNVRLVGQGSRTCSRQSGLDLEAGMWNS